MKTYEDVIFSIFAGIEYIMVHYRWFIVCFFLLPASFVFDMYMMFRAWIIFKMNSAPKMHDARVKHIQDQVRILSDALITIIKNLLACYFDRACLPSIFFLLISYNSLIVPWFIFTRKKWLTIFP